MSEIGELVERRRVYNATVLSVKEVHSDLRVLRLVPDAGIPSYVAGQFITIGLGVWEPILPGVTDRVSGVVSETTLIKRAYSISSSMLDHNGELWQSGEEPWLELYVTLVRDDDPRVPSLTCRLFALSRGDRLWVDQKAKGHYTLGSIAEDARVLFLGTGTGEAPHNNMTLELLRNGHAGPIASVVSARYRRDHGYLATHRKLEQRFANYRFLPLTTREGESREHIQDLLADDRLAERIGFDLDPTRSRVFLCGHPGMVREVEEVLTDRGFSRSNGNLSFERYWSA